MQPEALRASRSPSRGGQRPGSPSKEGLSWHITSAPSAGEGNCSLAAEDGGQNSPPLLPTGHLPPQEFQICCWIFDPHPQVGSGPAFCFCE